MEPLELSEKQDEDGAQALCSHDDNAETSMHGAPNLERPAASAFERMARYCNSYHACELLFCLTLCLSVLLLGVIGMDPRQRAIPYQMLSTGEFALNQVYDQEFAGETISSLELLLYGIAFPFFMQL
jgi:hypothetical protein